MQFIIIITLINLTYIPAHAKNLTLVASTTPIAALLKSITGDNLHDIHVIAKNQDPHSCQVSFMQKRLFDTADAIFFVNENMEQFIQKYDDKYHRLSDHVPIIHYRKGNIFSGRISKIPNYHVLFCMNCVRIILQHITEVLSDLDPDNAVLYWENLLKAENMIQDTKYNIAVQLYNKHPKFIVMHDGYQYFENEFNVMSSGVVFKYLSHTQISPKTLGDLLNMLKQQDIRCIISDPFHTIYHQFFVNQKLSIIDVDPELMSVSSLKEILGQFSMFSTQLLKCTQ